MKSPKPWILWFWWYNVICRNATPTYIIWEGLKIPTLFTHRLRRFVNRVGISRPSRMMYVGIVHSYLIRCITMLIYIIRLQSRPIHSKCDIEDYLRYILCSMKVFTMSTKIWIIGSQNFRLVANLHNIIDGLSTKATVF